MKTPPYRAKPMKPVDPKGKQGGPEYSSDKLELMTRPPKKPGSAPIASVLVDGPYGGRKPQS